MPRIVPILLSTLMITMVSLLGKRFTSLSGVLATMPLLIPLSIWAFYEANGRDYLATARLVTAMLPGIILTASFVVYARFFIGRGLPIYLVIGLGYLGWFLGYLVFRALSIL